MKKEKEYTRWFSADTIREGAAAFDALTGHGRKGKVSATYKVTQNSESWTYDTRDDFYNAYGPDIQDAKYSVKAGPYSFYASYSAEMNATKIGVASPERKEIEAIFTIFESAS